MIMRANFKIQGCHDLTMLCLNISDIAINTVESVDSCCIIHDSKSEAIHLLEILCLKIVSIYKNVHQY